jgi:hypothetical protein
MGDVLNATRRAGSRTCSPSSKARDAASAAIAGHRACSTAAAVALARSRRCCPDARVAGFAPGGTEVLGGRARGAAQERAQLSDVPPGQQRARALPRGRKRDGPQKASLRQAGLPQIAGSLAGRRATPAARRPKGRGRGRARDASGRLGRARRRASWLARALRACASSRVAGRDRGAGHDAHARAAVRRSDKYLAGRRCGELPAATWGGIDPPGGNAYDMYRGALRPRTPQKTRRARPGSPRSRTDGTRRMFEAQVAGGKPQQGPSPTSTAFQPSVAERPAARRHKVSSSRRRT